MMSITRPILVSLITATLSVAPAPITSMRADTPTTLPVGIHKIDTLPLETGSGLPDQESLSAIVRWLAANFNLPANFEHPRIERVPARTLAMLRYKSILSLNAADIDVVDNQVMPAGQRDIVAVYVDASRTIYLPTGWSGATPPEMSILVHEMVHHLQNLSGFKYQCPHEREKMAYAAQEQWLRLSGRDLLSEFELDPFTLLVSTSCQY